MYYVSPSTGVKLVLLLLVTLAMHHSIIQAVQANERLRFTTRQILHDPATGLAIYGIDPLSYFIHGQPMPGSAEIETVRYGVVWRFESVSNRAAFESDPQVYAPRFGGYDAFRLLSGHLAEGNPAIYEVDGDRLILFATELNRTSWRKVTDDGYGTAQRNWEQLRTRLPR